MMNQERGESAASVEACPEIGRGSRVTVRRPKGKRWPRWAAFGVGGWGPGTTAVGTVVWRNGIRVLVVLDDLADDHQDWDGDGVPSVYAHLAPVWALVPM